MDQSELVKSIGDTLTTLDMQLTSGDPLIGSADWHQLYAIRKHLDDQQRSLLQKEIQTDDVAIQTSIGVLQKATDKLNEAVAQANQIAKIIRMAGQIAASLDGILKQFTPG